MQYIKCAVLKHNIIKMLILIIIYAYIVYNYLSFEIFKSRGSFWGLSVIWGIIVFFMLQNIKLHQKKIIQICNIIEIFLIPMISVFAIEIMCNPLINDLSPRFLACNYLLLFVIELLLTTLLGCSKGLYVTVTLAFLFGMVNYFIIKFKGTPFMPTDIMSVKTAINVVDHYEFAITQEYVTSFLIYIFEICLIKFVGENRKSKTQKNLVKQTVLFLMYLLIIHLLFDFHYPKILNCGLDGWRPIESYYAYGSAFAFLLEMQELRPEKRKEYSATRAREILDTQEVDALEVSITPNIIIILNESFGDLSVWGDIDTDRCLFNWKNADYIMRGYAYSSVYGGTTCNSEFEMLTGSSMAFFPGTLPYQNYNLGNIWNIVDVFRENGYSTVALHPADATNWNREKVYANLGFDEFVSIEDFINPVFYHGYVSDKAVYDKIIDIFERKESPLFLFGITMQNHGGYDLDSLDDSPLISIEEKYLEYEQIRTYMTLIQESDTAFKVLYDYFAEYDEPTIVCMFGDHQVELDTKFLNALQEADTSGKNEFEKVMTSYKVPYIIFANYDLEKHNIVKDTSLNYLGTTVLRLAGFTNSYFDFIENMQRNIPVINEKGYMTNDGVWHQISETNDYLTDYEIVQYYNLFDKK